MAFSPQTPPFKFYLSSDIKAKFSLKICNIQWNPEGKHRSILGSPSKQFTVICQLWAEGNPLSISSQTSYGSLKNNSCEFQQIISFDVAYGDLPLSTIVVITVENIISPGQKISVAITSFPLFTKKRIVRKGRQMLRLWTPEEFDFNSIPSITDKYSPSIASSTIHSSIYNSDGGLESEFRRSRIIFPPGKLSNQESRIQQLEKLQKKYANHKLDQVEWLDNLALKEIEREKQSLFNEERDLAVLYLELPCPEYPIVFWEPSYYHSREVGRNTVCITNVNRDKIVLIRDNEVGVRENPTEIKHRKMLREFRLGHQDHSLKPNAIERKQLLQIVSYPPTKQLSSDELQFIWKFRYYLAQNKKSLTKFFKCVDWTNSKEVKHITELISIWEPSDVDDVLELFSKSFKEATNFSDVARRYGISRLEKADDEELLNYLLQLVQALRYEQNLKSRETSLASFLISKAVSSMSLANYLYWYLVVETEDSRYGDYYKKKIAHFETALKKYGGDKIMASINQQKELNKEIFSICNELKASSLPRPKKIEILKQKLQKFVSFPSMPLPVNPSIEVVGLIPAKANIFKSATSPIKIVFKTKKETEYIVMFKTGDDLRQDQLVLQLILLMDNLLKKESLDLRLMPYHVLATSTKDGIVEFVPDSQTLSAILKDHSGGDAIRKFFRKHRPSDTGPYGIQPDTLETFIRSCAGYCVITHILGIGDRHGDNLMLCENGTLFHIDFGYILGKEPPFKPSPPPFKLSPQMVEGMGGTGSEHYEKFKGYCCEAYNILRKSANLILNLFSLMVDANIHGIEDSEKSIKKVQAQFRLELTDEQASRTFQNLINTSVNALFARVVDRLHDYRMYWEQ